ncbi:hypothetical protein FZEAL_10072 [Fusarium zealandicum]|uniref:Fanconi-associated nuclease n=1 Tax=Fusarium zealandicum TaxID=1053134 RepID=A0A8H4U640_9HYPO|nr:hypothetical protein FZEAL_10072 [Fusarium zealandicum]
MDAFVTRLPQPQSELGGQVPANSPKQPSQERPSKRAKREESPASDSNHSHHSHTENTPRRGFVHKDPAEPEEDDQDDDNSRPTDFESALPPTDGGKAAIEEYEALMSSQLSAEDVPTTEKTQPLWIRGRSSIYVDAFNLALDTVLEEESHLFDEKENKIFSQWKALGYEAQYLYVFSYKEQGALTYCFSYVRLFLRKAASWHRHSRLGYHSDISDLEAAIETLQTSRTLPFKTSSPTQNPVAGLELEDFVLGESFVFADASEDHIKSVEEAASLLNLDELKALAKEAKFQGRNKAELIKSLARMSQQQAGLMSLGLSRHNSRDSVVPEDQENRDPKAITKVKLRRQNSNREQHFLTKILAMLGPCVRVSPPIFKLFERVHLVFYRSTEWTAKSLTTIILAKIARRHFPEYLVCRTSTIFTSRLHLLEYEAAIRLEAEIDSILEFNGPPGEEGHKKLLDIFEKIYPRWKFLLEEEQHKEQAVYEMGEGAYLRRFTPAHSYTRIVHKAAPVFGKLKEHLREHELLTELLDQRLFHMARRGGWYQRKALLEEHYMPVLDPNPTSTDTEVQKKHWKRIAVDTCEAGLQDPDCHLIFHYDLQKRLVKLEKKLRIPRRLQHDFGHVNLDKPMEHVVEGVQLKKDIPAKPGRQASTKTIWFDELDTHEECSVEEMCLSHYRTGGWKGYHAEGGIIRTLFAYLFYDVLFIYIPNVFQTAYQTCPLDLHTDAFYPARASEINHRLVEIANGEGPRLIRDVWERDSEKRTSVVGLNWDFDVEDLVELVQCFEGSALAAVCKVMAQEYRQRGGGIPDLVLWRAKDTTGESTEETEEPGKAKGEVMFSEVKSANDRLSDTQRLWIHVLTGAGVKVALCNAVAKEVREDFSAILHHPEEKAHEEEAHISTPTRGMRISPSCNPILHLRRLESGRSTRSEKPISGYDAETECLSVSTSKEAEPKLATAGGLETYQGPCSTQQHGHNVLKPVSNLSLRAEDSSLVSDGREASAWASCPVGYHITTCASRHWRAPRVGRAVGDVGWVLESSTYRFFYGVPSPRRGHALLVPGGDATRRDGLWREARTRGSLDEMLPVGLAPRVTGPMGVQEPWSHMDVMVKRDNRPEQDEK